MEIANNRVVSFEYTLKNDAGNIIDQSEAGNPLIYLHGAENIIPGLERELTGKRVDDALSVSIDAADGYGEYDKELTQVVPKNMFEGVDTIEVGMQFQAQTEHGVQVIRVSAVDGDEITIDGNHPLAGERLHFDVKITDVREASAEELEHGHVHSEGSCH